ncbi:probable cytochrome P450 313a4 [Culicoides brevitarsis]|uniref:probable cytochrome P450 313a4 n=1 Tax=Culicoides brevitarsis TaxID=469753 RepID=UPI00307C75AA
MFLLILLSAVVASFLLLLLGYLELHRHSLNRRFRHIPGPKQYPIIGNLTKPPSTDLTDFNFYVEQLSAAPVTKMIVPGHLILGISDPSILQQILNAPEFLGRVEYFLKFTPWKEAMLTAACPEKWRALRKVIQPAFSHKNLVSIIPTFNKHLKCFTEMLEKYADTGVDFDFFELSDAIGMKQALETVLNVTEIDPNLMHDMFKKIVDNTCDRLVRIYEHPDVFYGFTAKSEECKKISEKLEEIFNEAIDRTLMDAKNANATNVLYFLLKQRRGEVNMGLTMEQVKDNALIMFGAGYETSAITISHVILMLAMHPEVDSRLYKELSENFKVGDTIDHHLLKKLPYLDMVFKETLRLFPTVPIVLRQANKEKFIDGIGLIPKGTIVIPNLYQLHRCPSIWGKAPEKFNPDNFLPENINSRHSLSFIPFSSGPRNCIGMEHAQLNIKLALVHILSEFRFETDLKMNELDVRFSVFVRLNNKYAVRTYRRQQRNRDKRQCEKE